jgi:hypothetical protein
MLAGGGAELGMSWRTQTIFVRRAQFDGGPEKLLTDLGYGTHRKVSEAPFSGAGAASVWIGAVGDNVVIYTHFAWNFFGAEEDENFNVFRRRLLQHFSGAEVTALIVDGTSGAWGFAVFRQGTLIRCQYGVDGLMLCNDGARLPIEDAYLARFKRREVDGEIRYRDPDHPGSDEMTEADLGEGLVVAIFKSFTGLPFDKVDGVGSNFWLSEEERRGHAAVIAAGSRPWWKFWG